MWNRVVGQIGQAWNQGFQGADEQNEAGVSSTQDSNQEVIDPDLSSEQYLQIISSKQAELTSLHAKYEAVYSKCKNLQSSYETDIQAERSVIEALKVQIQEKDKEQSENTANAEDKFIRLKQQARARIQELSKEIDLIKRGQEGDGKSTASALIKVDDLFGASPSSSRAGSPDRLQQELYEKEREVEELRRENSTLRQDNSDLQTQLSEQQEQLTQLQSIKNELKTSLASYDRVEQENAQLHSSVQEISVKNSLLESRINEVLEERKQSEDIFDLFKKSKLNEFQEVIHTKSEEIEALNNSLSLLRLEYGEEKKRRDQLESQVSALKDEKELSRERYHQLVLQTQGYTREIEQLKLAAGKENNEDTYKQSNSETVIQNLEVEVSELKSRLQDSSREIELRREEVLNTELELRTCEANLEDYHHKNEEISDKLSQNTAILEGNSAESDRLRLEQFETISQLRREVEEAEFKVKVSQTELNASTLELARHHKECDEVRNELREAAARERELENLHNTLQERSDQLEQEVDALNAKLGNTMMQLKERDENYVEIERKLHESEARLKGIQLESDTSKEVLNVDVCRQLEEKNLALTREIERAEEELFATRQANSSLSKVKQNLEEGLSISQAQIETQKTQIEELTQSQVLATEIGQLKENIELVNEENRICTNQMESVEDEVRQLSDQLRDKKLECDSITKDLNDHTREKSALETQVSRLRHTASERDEKISSLEVELEIMSVQLAGVQELKQALLEAEQDKSTHSQRISSLELELQGREGERVELETLRESGASEQEQFRDSQEESQRKITEKDLNVENLSSENKQIKDALDKSTQSINKMKLSLDSANSNNNKLISDVDKISREKAQLASDMSTLQDESARLQSQLQVKESELQTLLQTTETACSEMALLHSTLSAREEECRNLKERNVLLGNDAKRMQEGFDSALELMQDKLKKSETKASQLELMYNETEQTVTQIREERARAETQVIELEEKLKCLEERQDKKLILQTENQRLTDLTSGQTTQLESSRHELDSLQQENLVLRAAQENSLSGAHDQDVRSLQLSQEMARMARENEGHARKLSEVNKLLEAAEFERDQFKQENAAIKESSTQLQTLQIQYQQITVERNALKERGAILSRERDNLLQENSHLQSLQSSQPDSSPPILTEVPAATSYYVTQLEERLQNVGYTHAKELQRLSDMLEVEKLKSSQMEETLRISQPSEGLPLPATASLEDFSCLNQSTLEECLKVFKHQFARWKGNPKITLTRFFKSRPTPQLMLIAYFVCLHFLILITIF